jgi:hypothetical protein
MSKNNTAVVDNTSDTEVVTEVTPTEVPVPVYPNATPAADRTPDESVTDLEFVFDFQGGSPYKLIMSANRAFKAMGITKELATQMGYAYTKQGSIDGIKREGAHPTKGVTFTREVGLAWFARYVSKNLSK